MNPKQRKHSLLAALSLLLAASLQAEINIIPTPKMAEDKGGRAWLLRGEERATIVLGDVSSPKETVAAGYISKTLEEDYALELATKTASELEAAERRGNLILIGTPETNSLVGVYRESLGPDESFLRDQPSRQAYVINSFPNAANANRGVMVLRGRSGDGTVFAAVSFAQLVRTGKDGTWAQRVHIRDYPDIEFRWGMGGKVDDAIRWKTNLAPYFWIYQGFKPERSGYLTVNRYARERGMRPVSGLLGDLNLKNRESYPDGATYPCLGADIYGDKGYCLANEELLNLKCKRLKMFMERNEPGCLYIHFQDYDVYERTERAWAQRCPACRKRWPNGAIEAEDGKAGAQARVYNRLCDTIFSVKTDGGYDADRDCLVIFVCGPYGRWSEPDAVWDREIEYYVNLSRNMTRVADVQFCIREEAARQDGTRMRVAELSQALKEKGKGHDIFLYFHIGDRRTTYRNWPTRHQIPFRWLPTPAMSRTFEGARGMLLAGSAHAAMKAEYMWNRKPVGGYSVAPRTRSKWGDVYASLLSASKLPPEIFGKGKFFDRVYRNLYGETAGRHVADGLRPTAFHGGTLSPQPSHAWLAKIHKVWAFTDSPELQGKWSQLFARIAEANRGAMEGIRLALACEDLVPGKRGELETLREQYGRGFYWAELAQKEADSYATWLSDGKEAGRRSLGAVGALLAQASEAEAPFAAKVEERVEKAVSELENVRNAVALFEKRLESLRQTAPRVQEQIRKELRTREDYDLEQKRQVLGYVRIGLIGHHFRHLMEDESLGYCERLKGLTDEIMNYDVICYALQKKLAPEENALIRNFISAGRGFLVAGGTPFYATASVDLTPIADWLGASRYANFAGELRVELPSFLSQGQAGWLSQFESSKGAACLGSPVTGQPILTYQARKDLSFLLANKYGGGRVVYSSIAKLPQALTHKILLWLGYNKI